MKTLYAPQILVASIALSLGVFGKEAAVDSTRKPSPHEEVMQIALSGGYIIIGGNPLKGPLYRGKCSIEERDGKLFMTRVIDGKSETAELTYSQDKPEGLHTWNVNFPKAKIRISFVESHYHDNRMLLVGESSQYNAAGASDFLGVETAYPDIFIAPGNPETTLYSQLQPRNSRRSSVDMSVRHL